MKDQLIAKAKIAMQHAYSPYSHFAVGAALLAKSGEIYTGCNIENAAYSVTCCAERTAIFTAIANGEREFIEMAVIADSISPVPPCGSCRQVMAEFFSKDMPIHLANCQEARKTMKMGELLPYSFDALQMGTDSKEMS